MGQITHPTMGSPMAMVSPQAELHTLPTDGYLKIAKGLVPGYSFIHKFGNAPDFDIGDGYVTIWDGADDAGYNANVYTYSATADINSITSNTSTDVQSVEIIGLDGDYKPLTQSIALIGSDYVSLGSSYLRVFRMKNTGSSNIIGQISAYVSGPTTEGVVDDASGVRAIINNGRNQTLMAVYTIPSGVTGYLNSFYAATAGTVKTSANEVHLEIRELGGIFQTKHVTSLIADGTSHFIHPYLIPEIIPEKSDIEVHVNTDVNGMAIGAGFDITLINN